jgi:hypothetical protein
MDYRVRVIATFDLDIGTGEDPRTVAKTIVKQVFKESFSRADALTVTIGEVREL